jgi:hypothetical protein
MYAQLCGDFLARPAFIPQQHKGSSFGILSELGRLWHTPLFARLLRGSKMHPEVFRGNPQQLRYLFAAESSSL